MGLMVDEPCRNPSVGLATKARAYKVPGQNDICVPVSWPCIKYTIRGKVVTSPSSGCGESCKSMFAHDSSVHQSVSTTH